MTSFINKLKNYYNNRSSDPNESKKGIDDPLSSFSITEEDFEKIFPGTTIKNNITSQTDEKPKDYYEIGKEFEDYCTTLFPENFFNIVHYTTGKARTGRLVEDCILPDLLLRSLDNNKKFWIECKYRTHLDEKGNTSIATKNQINRYMKAQRKEHAPVYILLGIGGTPTNPERLFLYDLKRFQYEQIYYCVLKQAELHQRGFISINELEIHIQRIKKQ
ncbi:MAG: hypothetical protein E7Z70_02110 [Thermoplasmata archaeon]|nr:hypothetical protein [Thermoplasmata archaeon]